MLEIGPYKLNSKVLLAPMAGITDKPFRKLVKNFGAALTFSEMALIKNNLLNSNKSKFRLNFKDEASPIVAQIIGTSSAEFIKSAKFAVNLGAEIIDINMGCPQKKVCNKYAGSALLKNKKLVNEILTKTVKAVKVPVTLKMRTGWDNKNKNAVTIAKIAENAGIKMLTIHGRTREDKFNGNAEYKTIYKVVNSVKIPVIANGDINSHTKAKYVLDGTGAHGVMIGRAARGQPWIIKYIDYYLKTNKEPDYLTLEQKIKIILAHLTDIYNFYGDFIGTYLARKHIFWYANNLTKRKLLKEFWNSINKIKNSKIQYQLTEEFLINLCHK